MGKDPSTDGAPVTEQREPQDIRHDIEQTRAELGETVAEVAEKADVKGQARRKVEENKAQAAEKKDELLGKAQQASPDQAATLASQGARKARENPLPLAAVGAFAAGVVVGRAIAGKR